MKNFYALTGILLSVFHCSTFAEGNAELLKERSCYRENVADISRFERINALWLSDAETSWNIERNLKDIFEKHTNYLAAVRRIAEAAHGTADTADALHAALSETEKLYEKTAQEFFNVNDSEWRFLHSLNAIESELTRIETDITNHITNCPAPAKANISRIVAMAHSWRDQTARARSLIAEASKKRETLFETSLKSLRADLTKRYSIKVGGDLLALQNKLQGLLDGEKLYRKMLQWYSDFVLGRGTSLKNMYLQYEKPLMLIRQDLERGLQFQDSLARASDVHPDWKALMEDELVGYISQIRLNMSQLENGWEPIFERQKFLNSRRQAILASLTPKCPEALAAYDKMAATVKALADFREVEPLYIVVVDSCKRR